MLGLVVVLEALRIRITALVARKESTAKDNHMANHKHMVNNRSMVNHNTVNRSTVSHKRRVHTDSNLLTPNKNCRLATRRKAAFSVS